MYAKQIRNAGASADNNKNRILTFHIRSSPSGSPMLHDAPCGPSGACLLWASNCPAVTLSLLFLSILTCSSLISKWEKLISKRENAKMSKTKFTFFFILLWARKTKYSCGIFLQKVFEMTIKRMFYFLFWRGLESGKCNNTWKHIMMCTTSLFCGPSSPVII